MRKVFIVMAILLTSLSFLTFHDKGNAFLKPYVERYLESKLFADMQIELRHLKIDLNHIEFKAVLNEVINIEGQGEFSLFIQALNIDYTIKSNVLKNKIDINGTLRGIFNNFDIKGAGEIVQSKVNYSLNLKDDLFSHIKIKMDKADIASVLELTGQAPYATGKVDVNVDIENLEKQSTDASPQIVFHETILNQKTFKEVLDIELPSKTVVTAKLNVKFATEIFQINGVIKSDFATLNLSKSYYNRRTKELSSNYTLLIPRLSKLKMKQELKGRVEVLGTFKRKEAKVYLTGKCQDLGGRMVFDLKGNKLTAHLNAVDMEKLFYVFGEKPYVTGKLMADIELHDFKKREGIFNFKTKDAKTIDYALKKELNLNFGKDVNFFLNAKGNIGSKTINMEAKLDSDVFEYSSSDIKYDFSKKAFNSTYVLHIPDLSKLNSLTGKTFRGEVSINGELKHQDEMLMTGSSTSLGGNIAFRLKGQKLKAKMNNISVEKLMKILDYPQVFKANLIGKFNYDLAKSSGRFNSILNEAELLNTYLIQVIKDIRGTDLSEERYTNTYFNATFRKNLVDVNFKAQSRRVLLSIPSGQINKINNKINAYYKVTVDNKKLEGKIRGDLSDPELTLNSSKYIQNNMMSIIGENMKTGGMGKKEGNVMKAMMDGFFN